MTQKKREETRTHDPETCPRTVLDRRGSSRSVSRTFCRQCGTFVDEVPAEFQKQRRDAATSVLNASADVIDTVGALTAEDASADLGPAVVESIMGRFNDIVVDATLSGAHQPSISPPLIARSNRKRSGGAPRFTGLVAAGGNDGAGASPRRERGGTRD